MKNNPFKFGTVVSGRFFTNRLEEMAKITSVLNSSNHLIMIGPRRYGKTSLLFKVMETQDRPVIFIDMQLINTPGGLAAQLLKKVYKNYPGQKIKSLIQNFRIIPSISLNPVTNEIDVKFNPFATEGSPELEDVLNLIDKLGKTHKKAVVVFDEFQDIFRIDRNMLNQMRSILQNHESTNYVFLGSQESLIREIFEKKKSAFYHFGWVMQIDRIPKAEFLKYLKDRFAELSDQQDDLSENILTFTRLHPYYTQQLAFFTWELLWRNPAMKDPVESAIEEVILSQDNVFERLWVTLNTTDRRIMIGLAKNDLQPLSQEYAQQVEIMATSTIYSSLQRLIKDGFLIKIDQHYEFEDPFMREWLVKRLK